MKAEGGAGRRAGWGEEQRGRKDRNKEGGGVRTVVGVGALLHLEEVVQAERLVVGHQPLLVQLQLPQALVLLVAGRAGVLHQVEPGLGGVVAQRAVVDARLGAVAAVLLLQVLRTTERGAGGGLDEGSAKHTQLELYF